MNINDETALASMMIRKPANEVFNAFNDPSITTNFWFTGGSGKLTSNEKVIWEWSMYDLSVDVVVKDIKENESIQFVWGSGIQESNVEITFKEFNKESTYVSIKNDNFKGDRESAINAAKDSIGGFTLVLAGLKAYLEHGISLKLIEDKWPKEMRE